MAPMQYDACEQGTPYDAPATSFVGEPEHPAVPRAARRRGAATATAMLALGAVATFAARARSASARAAAAAFNPTIELPAKYKSPVDVEKVVYGNLPQDDVRGLFEKFQDSFGRSYEDDSEEAQRFGYFKQNLQEIDALNNQNPYALFGITKFSDYSDHERKAMKMSKADIISYPKMKETLKQQYPELITAALSGAFASGDASAQRRLQVGGRDGMDGVVGGYTMMPGGATKGKHYDSTNQTAFKTGHPAVVNSTQGMVGWVTDQDCAACERFPQLENCGLDTGCADNFDWRALGAVTAVKNQKYCGSCWTFATAADIEATWFLAGHPLHDLSEQQLVECDTRNYGCDGGWPFSAMQYVAHIGGLTTYEDYPYKGICAWDACEQPDVFYGTPKCDKEKVNEEIRGGNVAHIGGYQFVAMGAEYEDLMRVALAKNGPLALAFNANGMDFYVHGVAGCTEGLCDAGSVDHHVPCDPDALDHAVLLVGYGIQQAKSLLSDEGIADIAQATSDVPYWVIKNSWGADWGEDGYYRLLRGDNTCGIANMVVHSVVKDPRQDGEAAQSESVVDGASDPTP